MGIGYADAIERAQSVALDVVRNHPAVLKDPQPLVLVDSLGNAAVNLQVYFWMDGCQHNCPTVKSSLMRLVKQAFERNGISIPFEVRNSLAARKKSNGSPANPRDCSDSHGGACTQAEGGLRSEADAISEKADHSRNPDASQNLLDVSASANSSSPS